MLIPRRKNAAVVTKTAASLNLALVEFSPEWENTVANLARLDAVTDAVFNLEGHGGPDILILPECFSTGFSMSPRIVEFPGSSRTLEWMKRMAALYDCAVAGSVPVWDKGGKRFNRFYFVTPEGVIDTYDKRHLFFGGEGEIFTPGTYRTVLVYKGWKILPGICFDLRFPVWSRNNASSPYDLYINVANWPAARMREAGALLAARAIENVAYAAFCNRAGSDSLMEYSGGSAVVNHRGRTRSSVVEVCGTRVAMASLDMAEMLRFRASFPVLGRADNYKLDIELK